MLIAPPQASPKQPQQMVRRGFGHDGPERNSALPHFPSQVGKLFPSDDPDEVVRYLDRQAGKKGGLNDHCLRQSRFFLGLLAHEALP